jgi:hypothetical protein
MVGATLARTAFFAVMAWQRPIREGDPHRPEECPNALPRTTFTGPPRRSCTWATPDGDLSLRNAEFLANEEWLAVVRRWTLVPWIFLTMGIVAGAWWSYAVLGWGGYWAWDPVENAALLPWLTATAFIHSSMVAERRGTLRTWTHALVIATFVLTLVGTFLTRSGVVNSVHAFTTSGIGAWFAAAILLTLGVALGLLIWRLPDLGPAAGRGGEPGSAFLFNNVLFLAITFAILFGTLYPVVVEAYRARQRGAAAGIRVNAPILWRSSSPPGRSGRRGAARHGRRCGSASPSRSRRRGSHGRGWGAGRWDAAPLGIFGLPRRAGGDGRRGGAWGPVARALGRGAAGGAPAARHP